MMPDEGVTAEETLTAREERESIARRLERLEGIESTIVTLKFGLSGEPPLSIVQIGNRLGVTSAAVQKAVESAMRKLGSHPKAYVVLGGPTFDSRVG